MSHCPILKLFVINIVVSATLSCSSLVTPEFASPGSRGDQGNASHISYERDLDGGAEFRLSWPTTGARLSRGFQTPVIGRPHFGLDLAAARGTPIYSAHQGRVIYAGSDFSGYGKFIIVEYNKTWASFYSHLDKIKVKQGAWVKRGDLIGTMGKTGNASGVHLHFELRQDTRPVDPISYLPERRSLASHN